MRWIDNVLIYKQKLLSGIFTTGRKEGGVSVSVFVEQISSGGETKVLFPRTIYLPDRDVMFCCSVKLRPRLKAEIF